MGAEIDRLEVEIEASAAKANAELNKLINRLEKVSGTLQGINSSGLASFANGIESLGRSMQTVNSVKTSDFTRLVKNIQKVSSTDYTGLVKTASAMGSVARALNNTGAAMKSSESIVTLAGNIGKLGGKSIERAIINLPKLSAELKNLMTTLSQSPNVSKNVIQMTNALANLSDSLKGVRARSATASSGTKSFAKNLFSYSSSAQTATKRTLSLASAFGKFYATYWLLIRGFGQLKKAIDISSDLTEVQNVVDVTFGKYRGMLEDFASTSITEFGMSELTSKQIASRFQAMGTAMGFAQGQMADMSIGLTKLAADMASFYNVEQTDVAQDLEAIFTGQTRPLRTYGLDLTQATLQEWAMKQGIEANMKTMSQAEKTLLRYQYVLANTGAAQGDFARTSGTWANQTRILSQQFQALASTIGGVLINVLKPFVTALNKVMAKVREFAKTVADALGAIFGWTIEISGGGVADDFSGLAGSTDDLADNTGTAAGNLGNAADAAKKLRNYVLGFDELNILGDEDDSSKTGNSNGSGIGDIGGGYGSTGIVATESILEKYKSEIENLYQLGEYIGQALTDAMNSIDWDSIYAGARDFGTGLADFLNGLISPELFGATGRTIAGALNTAIYAALSFGETFDWADFGLSIATGVNEFFNTFDFASLAETINTWANGILTTIETALLGDENGEGGIDWEKAFAELSNFVFEIDGKAILELTAISVVWKNKWKILSLAGNALYDLFVTETLSLPLLVLKISSFGLTLPGTPAFDILANELLDKISKAIENILPDWAFDLLSKMGAGMVMGAALGAFGGPAGLIAGALIGAVGGALWSKWNEIVAWWDESIGKWWNDNVAPWFTAERWLSLCESIKTSLKTKWDETVGEWKNNIQLWWTNNVAPWFTAEKWLNLYDTVKTSLKTKWNEASSEWKSNINEWWNIHVAPWFTASKWLDAMSGIKDGFKESFKNAANAAIDIVNRLIRYLNEKLKIEWDGFTLPNGDKVGGFSKQLFRINEIPHFASGGYPETGQLFLARENGINEMIGRIGNRSAVANNDQIVQAITNAVAPAVYEAVSAALMIGGAGTNNQTPVVEVEIRTDEETLYRAVKKGELKSDRRYHVVATV